MIRSGDVIATACCANEPSVFLNNLHRLPSSVKDVTLWTTNTMQPYPVFTAPSVEDRVRFLSIFYSGPCRAVHSSGRISLSPTNLSTAAQVYLETARPTVFVAAVTPPDEEGNVHLSMDLEFSLECIEAADRVIFELNPAIPVTGGETAVPLSAADMVYRVDAPLAYAPLIRSTPEEEAIAGYVASLIHDGDCIQLGIGGMPNAVGKALASKRDLGIHTEMLTSTMGELIRAGVVTNRKKNLLPGKTVCAFSWGDQQLYDLMDHNPDILLRRASWVNDPFVISQNDNVVSVNTALQVDLTGQVCSESIGTWLYSGAGGAFDFAYGAYRSKGGRSIIALNAATKDGAISKIRPFLVPGSAVTVSRTLVDYVVTEFGIAKLRNRSVRQRVENLIAVAHPDFRRELRREAEKHMIW